MIRDFRIPGDFYSLRDFTQAWPKPSDPDLLSWFFLGNSCQKELNASEAHFEDFFECFLNDIKTTDDVLSFLDGLMFSAVTDGEADLFFRFTAMLNETPSCKINWADVSIHINSLVGKVFRMQSHHDLVHFSNELLNAFDIDNRSLFPLVFTRTFHYKDHQMINPGRRYLETSPISDDEKALGFFYLRKVIGQYPHTPPPELKHESVDRVLLPFLLDETFLKTLSSHDILFIIQSSLSPKTHPQISWNVILEACAKIEHDNPAIHRAQAEWSRDTILNEVTSPSKTLRQTARTKL